MKTTGGLKAALSYGMTTMKMKYRVRDGNAKNRVLNTQPIFYFSQLEPENILVQKMKKKGDEREFEGIGMRLIGNMTLPQGDVEFKTEKIASGVYKVTFAEALLPGEYAFVIPGGTSSKVFDFAVDATSTSAKR